MVDVSIVNGIMNQLITGGHHPVHVWIVRPMVLSGPGRSGPAEILSGKFHGDDMPTCESVLTHPSEDQLASGYARVYIYMVIDLKVLVRSFNCESRECYVGNPRESFFSSSRK